jgi:hypothetical protein
MKKLFFSFAFLFLFASFAKAEMGVDVVGFVPGFDMNYTSSTCSGTPSPQSTIISTTAGSELYVIEITSAGAVDSFFMVFDASGSIHPGVTGSTTTARVVSKYVAGTPARAIRYRRNIFRDGIGVYIVPGSGSPCLDIRYNSRW